MKAVFIKIIICRVAKFYEKTCCEDLLYLADVTILIKGVGGGGGNLTTDLAFRLPRDFYGL